MNTYDLLVILPAIVSALCISYISIPVIIRIAKLKHLIDEPDGVRKKHENIIPTLGGIGIFSAFIISYSVWGNAGTVQSYPFFIAALFLLFLIGVKDDILVISPIKKLLVQIVAAVLLVVGGGIIMTDFGGMFGLNSVPWIIGAAFSVFVMVAIINSFNLIDGIDGLAGGIGVIVTGIFGIWFWGAGFMSHAILAFTLTGALIGFLIFNMNPAKIFMGDTGSMSVGFILGYLALEFISLNAGIVGTGWHVSNAHIFAVAILIIPIVDTLRVFAIRSSQGMSPFAADRNHTHHKLLDMGLPSHFASFSLWLSNIFIIGIAFTISTINVNFQLAIILFSGFMILPVVKFIHSTSFIKEREVKESRKERKSQSSAYHAQA